MRSKASVASVGFTSTSRVKKKSKIFGYTVSEMSLSIHCVSIKLLFKGTITLTVFSDYSDVSVANHSHSII